MSEPRNVMSIPETISRLKSEGLPVAEYTLRRWIKSGAIPTRRAGKKALLYYPNVIEYLCAGDTTVDAPVCVAGIRRIDSREIRI